MGDFISRLPLVHRFALAVGIMLLPIVIIVVFAFGMIRPAVLNTLERITAGDRGSTHRIEALENTLLRAVIHADHYLMGRPEERRNFLQRLVEADTQFEHLRDEMGDASIPQLTSAYQAWREAKAVGLDKVEVSATSLSTQMDAFDALVWQAVRQLDDWQSAIQLETQQQLSGTAQLVRLGPSLIFGAFGMALLLAILGGFALFRSVLRPIADLARSAARVGSGDLGHRVRIDIDDEVGQLASTFNEMAARLEKHQQELEALSLRDELTGVANYRGLQRVLETEFTRSERYGTPLSLLILDLDHFKSVNDTHGHPMGDEVLRQVAALLGEVVRPSDSVGRYGGEEFAIVLPQTELTAALRTAERVRATIEQLRVFTPSGKPIGVTTSVGAAARTTEITSVGELVHIADSALYRAKRAGRNRVCQSEERPTGQQAG